MRLTGPLQGGVGFLFSLWGRVLTAGSFRPTTRALNRTGASQTARGPNEPANAVVAAAFPDFT